MKKILLAVGLLFCSTMGFSQLSMQDSSSNAMANGDTMKVVGMVGYAMADHFYIYNGGTSTVAGTNTRVWPTKQYTSNCAYSICVGTTCYASAGDSNAWQCPKAFSVPVGQYANKLFTDYTPNKVGITTIMAVVYDKNNTTDSTWFFVQFNAKPTGVAPVINNLSASSLFPNPANASAAFTYHSINDAQLSIYNSLGQTVKTLELSASKETVNINVSDMPSGIYICKLQSQGAETVFRKLVVSH